MFPPCEHSLFYRFLELIGLTGDGKRGSAQIYFILWSRRSPKSWASHSGLQSSNWFYECEHQLLRETDDRDRAHGIQGEHGSERVGERRSCENAWPAHTRASVSFYQVFHFWDRYCRISAHSHWSRKIFYFISLSTFTPVRKSCKLKALGTLIFSAHPSKFSVWIVWSSRNFDRATPAICCFPVMHLEVSSNLSRDLILGEVVSITIVYHYGKVTIFKLLFLGHRNLIKKITQTAVINIVFKRIFMRTWRFVC